MSKAILSILAIFGLCYLSYLLGKSQTKTEFITKEVEVIKYENKEICNLLARPNLGDDAISQLFELNQF